MTNHWFIRNKTDNSISGPYTGETIKKYMAEEKLDATFQLSQDKNYWQECDQWKDKLMPAKLGKYNIIRELGQGGMGVVYLARDTQLQRNCALKVLLSQHETKAVQRFCNEARSVAQLKHPSIIEIYEVHTSPQCFIAMEYIAGISFKEYMHSKQFSLTQKLQVFSQICGGVAHAHSQMILHRDLKPDNIIISKKFKPTILDFGIAKNINSNTNLTKTNEILGTPKYMSPEMILGKKSDYRGDVYSLGVLLYEMLTGSVPFVSDNLINLIHFITSSNITPPSCMNVHIKKNSDLEIICLKALEKNPEKRIASVSFLKKEIDNTLLHKPIRLKPPTNLQKITKWCSENTTFAASIALVGVSLLLAVSIFFKAKIAAEQQRKTAQQNTIVSKKNLVRNMLHSIKVEKYTSDVFSHYKKIKHCYKELLEIMKLDSAEITEVKKLSQDTNNHLRFLVLPRFPHTIIKKIKNSTGLPKLSTYGNHLTQVTSNNKLNIWRVPSSSYTKKTIWSTLPHVAKNTCIFSSTERYVIYLDQENDVCVYDLKQQKKILTRPRGYLNFCMFTPDERFVVLSSKTKGFEVSLISLKNYTVVNTFSFRSITHTAASLNSKWILFYSAQIKSFLLYDIDSGKQRSINSRFSAPYTIFFNKTGNKIFLFNIFELAIYDIAKNNFEYYDSVYERNKKNIVTVADDSFVINDEEKGILVIEKQEKNILHSKFTQREEEEIYNLLYAPDSFLGFVKYRGVEIRDYLTRNIITTIELSNSIVSAKLVATDYGIDMRLTDSNSLYRYLFTFAKLRFSEKLYKMAKLQKKFAKKLLFNVRIFIKENRIVYASNHGFVTWLNGKAHYWGFYKLFHGKINFFVMKEDSNELYVVHNRNKIFVYNTMTNKIHEHKTHIKNVSNIKKLSFSTDYKKLYIFEARQGIFEQNISENKTAQKISSNQNITMIREIDNKVVIGYNDGHFKIVKTISQINIDLPTNLVLSEKLNSSQKTKNALLKISFHKKKQLIATVHAKNVIQIWSNFDIPKQIHELYISKVQDTFFSPNGDYLSVFTQNRVLIYRTADFIKTKTTIVPFEVYSGYYKSGKAAFSKNWNKAYFSSGKGIIVFEQSYMLSQENFNEKILKCDKIMKQQEENSIPLSFYIQQVDKYMRGKK